MYSEILSEEEIAVETIEFRFPSNGKVYSEIFEMVRDITLLEQFRFPSNGKVYSESFLIEPAVAHWVEGFDSLQTGKCIQS